MIATLWSGLLFFVILLLILGVFAKRFPFKRITVFEHQKALRYSRGRYVGTLNPGQYGFFPMFTSITPIDVRPEFITIPGQDVLSADGVSLKISLAAEFEIAEPHTAVNKTANFRTALYLSLQMALREIVGKEKIDALMENRSGIPAKLMELTSAKASTYGLKLISADVKDIMVPGEMKKAFAQVVKAQKEGQAALERARGETAALRSLANAARMMDDNPNLLQLRALQALAESSGNMLVFGLPNSPIALAKPTGKSAPLRPEKDNDA